MVQDNKLANHRLGKTRFAFWNKSYLKFMNIAQKKEQGGIPSQILVLASLSDIVPFRESQRDVVYLG
jgi:hypothetical protein